MTIGAPRRMRAVSGSTCVRSVSSTRDPQSFTSLASPSSPSGHGLVTPHSLTAQLHPPCTQGVHSERTAGSPPPNAPEAESEPELEPELEHSLTPRVCSEHATR